MFQVLILALTCVLLVIESVSKSCHLAVVLQIFRFSVVFFIVWTYSQILSGQSDAFVTDKIFMMYVSVLIKYL